jgi:hypothetical protein
MENNFREGTTRHAFASLEVGESLTFPASMLGSAKTNASDLGFMLNRKFRVHKDNQNRTVIVKRVK